METPPSGFDLGREVRVSSVDFSRVYAEIGFEFRLLDLALLDIFDDTPEEF